MLNLEICFHAELGTLFDREGLGLESVQSIRGVQIDDDIWTTLYLCERQY